MSGSTMGMGVRTTTRNGRSIMATGLALGALGLTLFAGLLGGCYAPGGQRVSGSASTYVSTTSMPQIIQLYDTRDGTLLWEYRIPVGEQVVLKFRELPGDQQDPGYDPHFPDMMQWALMPLGRKTGQLDNSMAVPPYHARMLRLEQYENPALPEGYEPLNRAPETASADGA